MKKVLKRKFIGNQFIFIRLNYLGMLGIFAENPSIAIL